MLCPPRTRTVHTEEISSKHLHNKQQTPPLSHNVIVDKYLSVVPFIYKTKTISKQQCMTHTVSVLSHIWLFATALTAACQAPLSMGFPRQEYWSGLPFPSPGDLSNPGIETRSPVAPALAGEFFNTEPPVKPVWHILWTQSNEPVFLFPLLENTIGRLGGGWRGRGHVFTYGWFMLMYGRNQHNIAKLLSFYLK